MWTVTKRIYRLNGHLNQRAIGSVVDVPQYPLKPPVNEPILGYLDGSPERKELEKSLKKFESSVMEIPIVIGNDEITTCEIRSQVMPHEHCRVIAQYSWANKKMILHAMQTATKAQRQWDQTPMQKRYDIWTRAADLMAGKYRADLVAATMLGQSKTAFQAEIDAAAELVDFLRLHMYYFQEQSRYAPISTDPKTTLNSLRYRGIDGFIAAISPFNFTAIAGNLAYTPAFMGNCVVWKPSDTAMLSNWIIFNVMREAGVPPGVVSFVPSDGPVFGNNITCSPDLAGINFTGSVPTFTRLWRQIGENINIYRNFPRIVGECGGKNFHFIHPSAELCTVAACTVRSAFEYSGQKCSACSRAYVPESMWPSLENELKLHVAALKMGDVQDFTTFASAVIDRNAFVRISRYLERAHKTKEIEVIAGGECDSRRGYFIQPTIVRVEDPMDPLMREEIFGPILAIYVYKDADLDCAMDLVESSTPYALTGAVFAQDEQFCRRALEHFKMAAGNFYINDKSTGAVVGQQPFGGARQSGTNDKAGGPIYALRWTSPQSVKETFVPLTDVAYPYMTPK